jgi:hypothetical protein
LPDRIESPRPILSGKLVSGKRPNVSEQIHSK